MAQKPHILFVDDEPKVLASIQRMVRGRQKSWDISYANSAHEALEVFGSSTVDILISDIRMPHMTGQELFDKVQAQSPRTVRIALSGIMEMDNVVKTLRNVHRYMTKPCDTQTLILQIEEALATREELLSPSVQELITKIGSLPILPTSYQKIEEELAGEAPSMQRIADIISLDPGLVAAVLKLTNSPFFGLHQTITSVFQAINLLGTDTIKALVLSQHLFWGKGEEKIPPFSIQLLWEHSLRVGNMARLIGQYVGLDRKTAAQCRIAGMLHDIGKLILANAFPRQYEEVLDHAQHGLLIHHAEKKVLGISHAEVGMHVMELWGVHSSITAGIGYHHTPRSTSVNFSLILAVANYFDHLWISLNNRPKENLLPEELAKELEENGTLQKWQAYILEQWPEITQITGFQGGTD